VRRLFLFAYTCSGFAGLIYQVGWTRLLTLYVGHTTAAASAVVAAFLGGLAVGATVGGVLASRVSRRQSLIAYASLELGVALAAFLLPFELDAFRPLLAWAYADGASPWMFPAIRLLVCLTLVFLPAAALGATFPLGVRWFASATDHRAQSSGTLYALNTAGAAVGAWLAGFALIPHIGLAGTTYVGITASAVAAVCVLTLVSRHDPFIEMREPKQGTRTRARRRAASASVRPLEPRWLIALVLGISGFAGLVHEIAWTRTLTLMLGPTIYAFSAALVAVIGGVAIGSAIGTWFVARVREPAAWLAFALAGAAIAGAWTTSLAGRDVPRLVAQQMATMAMSFDQLLWQGTLLSFALIVPTALCLGVAFPLALALVDDAAHSAERRFGLIYGVNTVGAVSGSLLAGFVFVPRVGLRATLLGVSACLVAAAVLVIVKAALSRHARVTAGAAAAASMMMLLITPPWDHALLASGAYMYAAFVPKDLDLETMLKAGTLLYYREGAAATVSVKRLTGTTTLAVDGKTDASNRGDMLTQKLVAHLPLLLHDRPRDVAVIGLGSGVTVGSILRHPVTRVDVVEISPEVVEASRHFADENAHALGDGRTNLIVGDGRSHLLLARRQYDVIISEPSNPWIAGVAALFTREFFLAAHDRLAPGGIICQWANAYNISNDDLRSIVATFRSVFPDGTAWLVGEDDVVLVASRDGPLDARLSNIERHWTRPGVAADLAHASVLEPFALWSLFVGGPRELEHYAGNAAILTDDRMTLEFSAPRELHKRSGGGNAAALSNLLPPDAAPEVIKRARASAGAAEWRNRAAMMTARDAHSVAYDDYVRALQIDPTDAPALEGLVKTALLTKRGSDALSWIQSIQGDRPASAAVLVATSKLLASIGASADAVDAAKKAAALTPVQPIALEQLASLFADAGDVGQLEATVASLRAIAPDAAPTNYYAAVAALLRGNPAEAAKLADKTIAVDPLYAPVYDLVGAAHAKLGDAVKARAAFERSLTFDAHDSTAYVNLGVLAFEAGQTAVARNYFAEALWLDSASTTARRGLAATMGSSRE
jgi:spermidine synthase